jgi:hypothetical protein
MNKCSPVEMRKALEMVATFKDAGIGFIPIPILSKEHEMELMRLQTRALKQAVVEAEGGKYAPAPPLTEPDSPTMDTADSQGVVVLDPEGCHMQIEGES